MAGSNFPLMKITKKFYNFLLKIEIFKNILPAEFIFYRKKAILSVTRKKREKNSRILWYNFLKKFLKIYGNETEHLNLFNFLSSPVDSKKKLKQWWYMCH